MNQAHSPTPARVFDAGSGLRFVIAFGILSFFADMTYEGMRAISGPYLALLGASGAIVGLVAGGGELLGYALRLASGRVADRSGLYWPIAIAGYVVQMFAVPALALTGNWPAAAALIVLERVGKAVRNPPAKAMLARAGDEIGHGWAFGLHEALDQAGAMLGPLITAAVLYFRHDDYRLAFAWLLVPAVLTVGSVISLSLRYPQVGRIPAPPPRADGVEAPLPRAFWWYCLGSALVAFGFADYALVAYHYAHTGAVSAPAVPVLYALAMGTAGVGSVIAGRWFDRRGLAVLLPLTVVGALYAPLVFLGGFALALTGTLLWGFGVGVHEALMSAAVAKLAPRHRRARAYGLFTAIFGCAWFAGSAVLGALYDRSVGATVIVGVAAQLAALLPIALAARAGRRSAG